MLIYIYIYIYIYMCVCVCVCVCMCVCVFTTPTSQAECNMRSIFKRFSFRWTDSHTNVEESSLTYYLSIVVGRIVDCIRFSRVLVLCEMGTTESRIWTWVTVSIFYDDNHCAARASLSLTFSFSLSLALYIYIYIYMGGIIIWNVKYKYNLRCSFYSETEPR